MRAYVRNVIDAQDPGRGDDYFAENFFNHDPAPGEEPGIKGVEAFIGSIFAAFSGFRTNVNEQMADGDFVVGRWTQTFKQTGSYLGFPVTGIQVLIGGITITRVRNNRIIEEWEARDAAGLLQQMGVAPKLMLEGGDGMSSDATDVVNRFFYDIWNAGNVDLVDEVLSPGFVNHIRLEGQRPGREGMKQLLQRWRLAFPDASVSVDLMLHEGDRVAARYTARGTHRDAFLGIPASGKPVEFTGIHIFRVENGKLVEGWGYLDLATLLMQLGALKFPTAGEPYAGGAVGGSTSGAGAWQPGGGPRESGSQPPGVGYGGASGGGYGGVSGGGFGGALEGSRPSAPPTQSGTGGGLVPGSPEDVARRWFAALNKHDANALASLVAPDVVDHSGLSRSHGQGQEGHRGLVRELCNTLPDWRSKIECVTTDGDLVTIRHTGRASPPRGYSNIFGGESNQPIEFEMVSTVRVRNGKIVEHWANSGPFGTKGGVAVPSASPDELKRIAQRWFDAINRGDIEVLDDLVHYDVVDHSGLSGRHGHGCDGHKQLIRALRNAIPDWRSQIQSMSVDGDTVTIRHTGSGTAPPEFAGIAGDSQPGGRVEFELVSTVRIANGKIVEHWVSKGPFGVKDQSTSAA
jgi:steroid delta-isomerase-like uncharacterized protein